MIVDLPVLDFETPRPCALGIGPLLHNVKIFLDEKRSIDVKTRLVIYALV